MDKGEIILAIKPYCEKREDVVFAILFGSYASERASLESDIDIAVYLRTEDDQLENEIQSDLERLLGKEVDLVILNRAPATLSWNIIRKGLFLTIKDRDVYLDFMLENSTEAEDFIDFNLDTYRRKYVFGKNR